MVIPTFPQNEIQCVKVDESVIKGIELNVTNAIMESIKKQDEDKAQSLNAHNSFETMKHF